MTTLDIILKGFQTILIYCILIACSDDTSVSSSSFDDAGSANITKDEVQNKTSANKLQFVNFSDYPPLDMVGDLAITPNEQLLVSTIGAIDSNLLIYDLKTDRYKGMGFAVGEGPHQMYNFTDLHVENDNLYSFDPEQFKLLVTPLKNDSLIYENSRAINFADYFVEDAFVANKQVYGIPLEFDADTVFRFIRSHIDSTTFTKQGYVDINCTEDDDVVALDERIAVLGYSTCQAVQPNTGKFVLGYKSTDLIELYSSDGTLIKSTRGPDFFCPKIGIMERNGGFSPTNLAGETRKAYTDIASTEEYYYALYLDGKFSNPIDEPEQYRNYEGSTIYKFSWSDGSLQKVYQTTLPVYKIAVSQDNNRIYAITDEGDTRIVKAEI